MTAGSFQTVASMAAALLFILALAGLSRQKTAKQGNYLGMVGMAVAIGATTALALAQSPAPWMAAALLAAALAVGAVAGIAKARRVQMIAMPQLVALLHCFVGAAAVLVGFDSFLLQPGGWFEGRMNVYHLGEVGLAVFIGGVTFTGSIVANLKLSGRLSGKPLALPGRNLLNVLMLAAYVALVVPFGMSVGAAAGLPYLIAIAVLSFVLGAHLVLAIGGGDMPVVVSLLNSLSGWAAAMAGFTLGNDLLIVTGALVGSSGAYLSYIMCKGMNRSLTAVLLGGFGEGSAPSVSTAGVVDGAPDGAASYRETTADEVAHLLKDSKSVVIAPGYGMAVAQAQFPVAELAKRLRSRGADVRFAIHPVAGRMPGHMNVLLAEAKVPYDSVFEMDEVNDDFPSVDTVLVVGANDTVNPSAETDPASPIAGMPVLRVWEAAHVVVLKRSMGNAGYAGVGNPLFSNGNTAMLLGDAKQSIEAVNAAL